ncbi:hypothetical protein [Aquiflexum balticum]|uniref:hypothetical protein n=1 Tax=Aquiflexum balticum TaxID=280473 RepID=UPI0012FAC7B4|nr:hypothetical protein [Aquiflexum balticum]
MIKRQEPRIKTWYFQPNIGHPSSNIGHVLPTSHQTSVIGHPASVMYFPLPTKHRSSIIQHRSCTSHFPLPTKHRSSNIGQNPVLPTPHFPSSSHIHMETSHI